jgi:hypothetical protein
VYSTEYQERMDAYISKNAEERKKLKESKKAAELHSYRLEDYGLSKEKVLERFSDYINKYSLRDAKKN